VLVFVVASEQARVEKLVKDRHVLLAIFRIECLRIRGDALVASVLHIIIIIIIAGVAGGFLL
jgi:hypothetical protein